jgi:thiol-disulfide isomerase/thioredoxin
MPELRKACSSLLQISERTDSMIRTATSLCCLFSIVLAVAGCGQKIDPESKEATTAATGLDQTAPGVSAKQENSVEITVSTFDELQASIEASKGQIVVVDYWSTSCPPCMTEFPGLVAIHNEFAHDKVRCISVSLDYEGLADFPIEEARKSALEFLEQQKATFDNFILSEDSLSVMDDKLKIASIPAVFVFGVDGKLARLFDESSGAAFTYEKDVTPFVEKLVSQSFATDSEAADDE